MGRRGAVVLTTVQVTIMAIGMTLGPSAVSATTAVSGDRDVNAPLVIDPVADSTDPFQATLSPASQTVMFIQRMPVTKVINRVTLGNLAVGPGCATTTATAKVYEYNTGDYGSSADATFYSQGNTPISATPSELSWNFAPITMKKGRGYAFSVAASGCSALNVTTWQHNEAQVNPGPSRCTKGPQGWRRMWHEAGQDDRVAGCVDRPAGQSKFEPSMPTGWLISQVAQNGSGIWDVRFFTATGGASPVCYTPYYPNTYETYGGAPSFWRLSSNFPYNPEYTCRWTQWADWGLAPGAEPEHGWYHALPWLAERNGAPRDMYLKLETIDYDALLDSHSPIVSYDSEEEFNLLSPAAATDFYDASDDPDDPEDANQLVDDLGAFASANPTVAASSGIDALDLAYVAGTYDSGSGRRGGTFAQSGDYVSHRGDDSVGYFQDASAMDGLSGYGNQAYGRVVYDSSGRSWLQYWLYYYFDPQVNFLGSGAHEGDWEMIQVQLNSSGNPDRAAYAQHGGGEVCPWGEVPASGGHPLVYVARDSHASYFRSGAYQDPTPDDRADGAGGVLQPVMNQIWHETTGWVRWPGRWGDSGSSPVGPAFQGAKWSDPGVWADGLSPCDVD